MFANNVSLFHSSSSTEPLMEITSSTSCTPDYITTMIRNDNHIEDVRQPCLVLDIMTQDPLANSIHNHKSKLYGHMVLAKDWKDAFLSIIMCGMSTNYPEKGFHDYQAYKWVGLDEDIGAVWIEILNTVSSNKNISTSAFVSYLLFLTLNIKSTWTI